MADNARLLTRGTRALAMKRKARQQEVEEVQFDPKARQTFLTGFHKRKVERREKAAASIKAQERQEYLQMRKERREEQQEQLAAKLLGQNAQDEEGGDDAEQSGSDKEAVEVLEGAGSVTTVTVTRGFDADDMSSDAAGLERRLAPHEVAQQLERNLRRRMESAGDGEEAKKDKKDKKDGKKGTKKFRYETKAKRATARAKVKAKAKSSAAKSPGAAAGARRRK
ncbi:hypothetical protein H4S01_005956 [Coemansia sp. RSA 2610]|nr:hypothetical protein H4S01_005956 [Coemansia sp. RSA 2610]